MTNKEKILITGAAGFVGANLVRKLIEEGYEVHALVRQKTNLKRLNSIINDIILHNCDLNDIFKLKEISSVINPKYIINLAASNAYSSLDYNSHIQNNILGTYNLLYATKDIEYELFINAGSSTEYGVKNHPMRESDVLEPDTVRGATKAAATIACNQFALEFSKPIVTLRLFHVYGCFEQPSRLIPTTIQRITNAETLQLTELGFHRDYIFIDDVTKAFLMCFVYSKNVVGNIINIGSGIQTSNEDIVEMLQNIMNKKITVQIGKYAKHRTDKREWVADINKAKKLLKWKPEYSLNEGLTKIVDWSLNKKDSAV